MISNLPAVCGKGVSTRPLSGYMRTYKRLSHTRTAVKKKYLPFSFILDEISPPGLGTFLSTRICIFLDKGSNHILPGIGHNKAVDGPLIDLWFSAICDV
jgi:hypothetical protein